MELLFLLFAIACIGTFIVILLATQIGRKRGLVLLVGHFLSVGFLLAFAQLSSRIAGEETRRQFESALIGIEVMIDDGEASRAANAIAEARRLNSPTSPLDLTRILMEAPTTPERP